MIERHTGTVNDCPDTTSACREAAPPIADDTSDHDTPHRAVAHCPGLTIDQISHPTGAVLLRLRGDLDTATVPALYRALERLPGGGDRLVLDLREVIFLGTAGVTALHHAGHTATARQTTVQVLVTDGGPVTRALTIADQVEPLTAHITVTDSARP